ncbi:hypothetical protein E0Z10_g10827 [Xylaria hypoxylon]|uniref:RRM domain-containing protein n=1 Tax=Xylaria hypoxylon TaxID=37992 RepID=A0A4Z0YDD8_9PEZI|nr:hypothetical protein E0Z10_g10827 [Xylaria hypoxylon]
MTGNSPQVWAAANLDPVSPAPVYPPSPITVPTLQGQADTYFDMTLPGSDSMTSAVETIPRVPMVDEQTHLPAATIHDSTRHSTTDTRPVDVEKTDLDMAGNGVAERGDAVSVGISAENMQEPETPQSDAAEAEQDVSMSTGSTPQASLAPDSVPFPEQIPQPHHKLPEDSQIVFHTIVSNGANTRFSQPPTEQSLANNNHSSATSLAGYLATNIQALVDNINAGAAGGDKDITYNRASGGISNGNVLSQSTVLPPKPPTPEQVSTQLYHPGEESSETSPSSSTPLPSSCNGLALGVYTTAALGGVDPYASATVMPATTSRPNRAISASQSDSTYGDLTADQPLVFHHQKQQWDNFLKDERKYVSDAKWDLFPDGSRIFIGNLSSERINKRDVFNLFANYGRLAQISLKQAYGFVQYHTATEGRAAMEALQGVDLKGKKISECRCDNLFIFHYPNTRQIWNSPGHKRKRAKEIAPTEGNATTIAETATEDGEKIAGQVDHPLLDVQTIESSLLMIDITEVEVIKRAATPATVVDPSLPVYDLDVPRRYGTDVPDVQFLLRGVTHDFVSWVQDAFVRYGLSVDVMYLDTQFTRDEVIHRQVVEGVRAVVDLDSHAQEHAKISLQVFDRSDGLNVRFDKYQDLNPAIAAQLVNAAKSRSQMPSYYPISQYAPVQYPPTTQDHYVPPPYPNQNYSSFVAPDTGSSILDSATVDKILESLNGQQARRPTYNGGPPVDIDTLLATLGTTPHVMGGPPPPNQHGMSYMHPQPKFPRGAPHAGDSTRQVQDILTQLARPRQ